MYSTPKWVPTTQVPYPQVGTQVPYPQVGTQVPYPQVGTQVPQYMLLCLCGVAPYLPTPPWLTLPPLSFMSMPSCPHPRP